jgi:multiple sugar transport system substrate-binding protein
MRGRRLSRRGLLRAGAALAAGSGAAVAAGPRAAAGRPTRAHTVVTLVLRPYYGGFAQELTPVYLDTLRPFLDAHPGVRIVLSRFPRGDQGALISAILAGNAPDVFENYVSTDLVAGGYLLDLMPYVRQSNADLSLLPQGQVAYFTHGSHLYALPITPEWVCAVVNLTLCDQAGVAYPSPNWDYVEAEHLFRALARPDRDPSKAIYGGSFFTYYGQQPDTVYFDMWGGSVLDPSDPTRCTLDSPACLAATEYLADLVRSQAAVLSYPGDPRFFSGRLAVGLASDWTMVTFAQQMAHSAFKQDFWPLPRGPVRSANFGSQAYYGIPVSTRHPDLAWELLHWMTWVPDWQRVVMRTSLLVPPLSTLAPEYLDTLRTVAPPLRTKNLDACIEVTNHPVNPAFAYDDDAAQTLISGAYQQIWVGKASPEEALRQVTAQVDALERAAAASQRVGAAAQRALAAALARAQASGAAVELVPPPVAGLVGAAARPAPRTALAVARGTYTLTGAGSGLQGTADGFTFACTAVRAARATFTCRLVAVSSPTGAVLANGAKVGLMARGDLGGEAVDVSVEVAVGRGVHVASRALEGIPLSDQRAGASPGLLPSDVVLAASPHPGANYLRRPIWLRLVRDVELWTAYTSLDGVRWLPAGRSLGLVVGGVWVGIFASSHDAPPHHPVRAVFDHLSFTPEAVYQVGG